MEFGICDAAPRTNFFLLLPFLGGSLVAAKKVDDGVKISCLLLTMFD
jgi:hypothetical protein